jgi:hypothetical protein
MIKINNIHNYIYYDSISFLSQTIFIVPIEMVSDSLFGLFVGYFHLCGLFVYHGYSY